ncbi:tyrosine-type recombinase/integrase [Streptomyces brevispora]|uniref:tyrosine-type recombinase/integrase n=2 Tax=Streptomyces brevispora TaxID=887462 RepID=UPI00382EC46A
MSHWRTGRTKRRHPSCRSDFTGGKRADLDPVRAAAGLARESPEEHKRHIEALPPVEVELPWGRPEGERKKFSLLLTTRFSNAVAVNTWNTCTWKPALGKAGVIAPPAEGAKAWQWAAPPKDGFHALRHTYASIMPEAGESVVALARWLGHSSPAITLGYYAHFMPEAGSKGRGTIDGLLGQGDRLAGRNSPDSPQRR